MLAEPYLGERPVVHVVQVQPRISQLLAGQARIQPPSKANQLARAVTSKRRGHVSVTPQLNAAGFSELS